MCDCVKHLVARKCDSVKSFGSLVCEVSNHLKACVTLSSHLVHCELDIVQSFGRI